MVTWCVGSGRWVCLIACGFIHNYSLYLKPKLKYADGPGCLWTAASNGLYSQVSPSCVQLTPGPVRSPPGVLTMLCSTISLCKMRDRWQSSATDNRCIWFSARRAGHRGGASGVWHMVIYRPQAESRRRRDVGHPRSAGFRRREEDVEAAAAAERRRLQRVAVVSLHRAEGSCCNTACIDRKINSTSGDHQHPSPLHVATTDGA